MHLLNSPHHLLTDLTLPLLSLFSGKGLDAVIKSSVGADTTIEDLWLNFFCCSTNLNQKCLTAHTSGRLWQCVRASMTVLGLLPPVRDENGELLVDGGYLNSVPVDVMRKEMGVETVIVVDVEDKDFISFRISRRMRRWDEWFRASLGSIEPFRHAHARGETRPTVV